MRQRDSHKISFPGHCGCQCSGLGPRIVVKTAAFDPHRHCHQARIARFLPLLYVFGGAAVLSGYYLVPGGRGGPKQSGR